MTASTANPLPSGITREVLESGRLRDIMRDQHPDVALLSDADMQRSIQAVMARRPPGTDITDGIWVFGYGSLLWNPCVNVRQWRRGRIYGHHRDFRIRLTHGRGCPQAPGLMLGLVPGGSCTGMGLHVVANDMTHELLMLWRREMLTGVYVPHWVWLHGDGEATVPALTFVTDTRQDSYCGHMDNADMVSLLATGHGLLGSCAEYLDNTLAQLDAQGIEDRHLHRLRRQVKQYPGH